MEKEEEKRKKKEERRNKKGERRNRGTEVERGTRGVGCIKKPEPPSSVKFHKTYVSKHLQKVAVFEKTEGGKPKFLNFLNRGCTVD